MVTPSFRFLAATAPMLLLCGRLGAARVCDLPAPEGYRRIEYPDTSYAGWVQRLPLKADKTILGHDGAAVDPGFYEVMAVLDMPLLFKGDIEQCADWAFRLWAEHHRADNNLGRLYLFNYSGQKRFFRKSGKSFRSFLKWAMDYGNSFSIKKGCGPADSSDLRPGDMIVQNEDGGVGHVSVVVDACRNAKGERLYLIGYGFMPAQEFHIERAGEGRGMGGWFSWEGYRSYLEQFLNYGTPVPRRFE